MAEAITTSQRRRQNKGKRPPPPVLSQGPCLSPLPQPLCRCMGLSKRKSAAGQQGAFVGALHIMTETFLNTRIWLLAEAFAKLDTESGHRYIFANF